MDDKELQELLDTEAARINRPDFIGRDPVQFPRRFERQEDIEITALLASIIAWGKRTMICRDAERLLALMDNQPWRYVMEEGYEDLPDRMNIHRTMFSEHLKHYLRGLRKIYTTHDTLDTFAAASGAGDSEAPAWAFAEALQRVMSEANDGAVCPQCLPVNLSQTALKRYNMALRWLVRDDGIVDIGIWKSIPKSKLFIPLDVHAGNTARSLGLLSRKANDRKSVEQLTAALRRFRPDDPAIYDFALFGIGIGE